MYYRLLSVALGAGLISLGVYTAADSHGGGGGFGRSAGGGGFSRGGYQGSSFHSGHPEAGPYRSSGYNHVNNYYQAQPRAAIQPTHTVGNQAHMPVQSAHHGSNQPHTPVGNQPPHMPPGGHQFPQGQHPTQPGNWHHGNFNSNWANHPNQYPNGHWNNGWYNGYWHNYWGDQNWLWWGGAYGFWLGLDAGEVFVTETQPGVCSYWDGIQWVPWYSPGITPYQCPY